MEKLSELKHKKFVANNNLKDHRRFTKWKFRFEHKQHFMVLDIIILVLVLMNFGAVFMTNNMVIRTAQDTGQEIVLQEANPIMAEEHNLETSPQVQKEFMIFVSHAAKWGLMLMGYILFRFNTYTETAMIATLCIICFYGFIIGLDFFNDLGFYLAFIT